MNRYTHTLTISLQSRLRISASITPAFPIGCSGLATSLKAQRSEINFKYTTTYYTTPHTHHHTHTHNHPLITTSIINTTHTHHHILNTTYILNTPHTHTPTLT